MTVDAAIAANSPAEWDRIWSDPAQAEWRKRALAEVYDRIVELVPRGAKVVDLGGGVAATLGTIGGSGPTAAGQALWIECEVGGVTHWIPAWT